MFQYRLMCIILMILLINQSIVQAEKVAYEFEGIAYSKNGTPIGPIELSDAQKVSRLRTILGAVGTVTLVNGKKANNVRIVKLVANSFGNLDSVVLRSGFWEEQIPIKKISEINAAGTVIILGTHSRRMLKLYEINLSREYREIKVIQAGLEARRKNLNDEEKSLSQQKSLVIYQEKSLKEQSDKFREMQKLTELSFNQQKTAIEQERIKIKKEYQILKNDEKKHSNLVQLLSSEQKDLNQKISKLQADEKKLILNMQVLNKRERELNTKIEQARKRRFVHGLVQTRSGITLKVAAIKIQIDGKKQTRDIMTTNAEGRFQSEMTLSEDYLASPGKYKYFVNGKLSLTVLWIESLGEFLITVP